MGEIENKKIMTETSTTDFYRYSEGHIRRRKNKYRLTLVKLYRFVFDIFLFYLAFVWFRYGRLFDLEPVGFQYNYYMTVVWKVE